MDSKFSKFCMYMHHSWSTWISMVWICHLKSIRCIFGVVLTKLSWSTSHPRFTHIYRGWLIYQRWYRAIRTTKWILWFWSPNSRSERSTCSPYWNVLGDQILHFLEFFYYLLSHFENHWSNGSEIFTVFYCSQWISDFQSGLINSKSSKKCKI